MDVDGDGLGGEERGVGFWRLGGDTGACFCVDWLRARCLGVCAYD